MNVLGLDLGTNSVGWALLNYRNDKLEDIVAMGSRIVPLDPDHKKSFDGGQSVTFAKDRRLPRGGRRLNQRFKQRRNRLIKVFQIMDLLPPQLDLEAEPQALDLHLMGQPLSALELYGLRAKAVREPISLAEWARVVLHMNQRRGYAPSKSSRRNRRAYVNKRFIYATIVAVEPTGERLKKKDELKITLQDGTIGTGDNPLFPELIGREVPLEIETRTNKKKETTVKISLIEANEDSWDSRIGAMESELIRTGKTPGQYFYAKLQAAQDQGEDFRIRQRLVLRSAYLQEYDLIWQCQSQHHPALQDQDLLSQVLLALLPQNSPYHKYWLKKGLGEFLRNYVLYYVRPLKSQKGSIAKCEFESEFPKRVIPKSHPLFQEFKLWNQVNNLKIRRADGQASAPSPDIRARLFQQLLAREKLSEAAVAKLCHCSKEDLQISGDWSGHRTRFRLQKAAQEAQVRFEDLLPRLEELWHLLYSLDQVDEEKLQAALFRQFAIPPEKSEPFLLLVFEKEYGNLSAKAIRKLLPLMRCGEYFDAEAIGPEVSLKIDHLIQGEADENLPDALRRRFLGATSTADFTGMQYWEAASLVYGDHRKPIALEAIRDWKELQGLPHGSLRNPVVEQIINETLQVIKSVWKRYGKPDRIHLEMPRALKQNAAQRKRAQDRMKKREKERDAARKELVEEFGIPAPSRKDILRYLLWQEANMQCIYSGETIPRTALFNGETDVDHIIPQRRFFDDSFSNKVLTFRKVNQAKSAQLPSEFISGSDWEAMVQRVENNPHFSPVKRRYLLTDQVPDGFLNRQLQDTGYISRRIRQELEKVCPAEVTEEGRLSPRVLLTSGNVTHYLKDAWQLDELFKGLLLPRFERFAELAGDEEIVGTREHRRKRYLVLKGYSKRLDHRHHALDALVVAATRQKDIQLLNTLHQHFELDPTQQKGRPRVLLPHPHFREMVRDHLEQMVVSHKARLRLLQRKAGTVQWRNSAGKLERKKGKVSWSIRGRLHEDTYYGKVKRYQTIPVKKGFDQLEELVVEWQQAAVRERLEELKGDVSKAKRSLKMRPLADGKGEPLEEVTVLKEVTTQVVSLITGGKPRSITKSEIDKEQALDQRLAKELKAHAAQYKDFKEAFSQVGIEAFNRGRKNKVFKVKLEVIDKPIALQPEHTNPRRIKTGSNFGMIISEDGIGNRRKEIISFLQAVLLVQNGEPLLPPQKGELQFFLQRGQMVYVLRPDEKVQNVDWQDRKTIAKRLYVVRQMSGKRCYFLHQSIAQVMNIKGGFPLNEYGTPNSTEFHDGDEPRTKIIDHCIRVYVDRLGMVSPVPPRHD